MTQLDILNIIAGLITIISFIFAVWIWMRSDTKIRELLGILGTIHDIAGTAMWESQMTLGETDEIRLQQADKNLGFITSIRKLTGRYVPSLSESTQDSGLAQLIEKGIIWTKSAIANAESSREVNEVWFISPDLKPDSSEKATGKLVNKNLKNGKRYVYFYPDDFSQGEIEIKRLLNNIGATSSRLANKVTIIPLTRQKYNHLFDGGNILLLFQDENRSIPPRVFEEIVLAKIPERGAFWQELGEVQAKELRYELLSELNACKED